MTAGSETLISRAGADIGWQFLVVALFGAVTGLAELTTRYKDNPRRLFKLYSAWAYLVGNAVVAAAALGTAILLQWDFGVRSAPALQGLRVIAAGFGGMLLLRSAIVNVRQDGRDLSIGPGGVVAAILSALDRTIDRHQAVERSGSARKIMQGISFELAKDSLVPYAIRLMESVSKEDLEKVSADAVNLAREDGSDQSKAYALGVIMIRLAGAEVLEAAVETLRAEITETGGARPANSPHDVEPPGMTADLYDYLLAGEVDVPDHSETSDTSG